MPDCSCPPQGLVDVNCREHGLYGDLRYPPMDRHARVQVVEKPMVGGGTYVETRKETAAEVQRRLYLAAAADRVRVEAAGFRWPLRACPPREMGQR